MQQPCLTYDSNMENAEISYTHLHPSFPRLRSSHMSAVSDKCRRASIRQKLLEDLRTSETAYIGSLDELVKRFTLPLRNAGIFLLLFV